MYNVITTAIYNEHKGFTFCTAVFRNLQYKNYNSVSPASTFLERIVKSTYILKLSAPTNIVDLLKRLFDSLWGIPKVLDHINTFSRLSMYFRKL